jgi:methionyl-tRNA formyltransferase
MKRILLIAPIDSSAFAACLLLRVAAMPGVEVAGVLVRNITIARAAAEWRRDGFRLLRKVWTNHILRGRRKALGLAYPSARRQLDEMGFRSGGLRNICVRHGWPIFSADDINSSAAVDFARSAAPTIAIFSGGGMVRSSLMTACGDGVLNCHMGPLPRYRGMDVVEWPFLEELSRARTAITVHLMDQGLDTGPIIEVADIPRINCRSIQDLRVSAEGLKVEALLRAIASHRDGKLHASPQMQEDGRQYYVLHPLLGKIAAQRAQETLRT